MTVPKWYIVHTVIGFEERVAEGIKLRATALGLDVLDAVVPAEEMPGYVLLHARLTDGCIKMVKETPKVTGLVGGNTPAALSQDEVDQILNKRVGQ